MQRVRIVALLFVATSSVVGCGVNSSHTEPSIAISGSVYGGSAPIQGATIQLWAVGTTSTSATPAPTPVGLSTTTDSAGSFSLANVVTCPLSNPLVYITARGGDAGAGQNPAIALMALLGNCNSLTSSTHIKMNEETTVVSVGLLTNFMNLSGSIGTTIHDNSTLELTTQFGQYAIYINPANGIAPGPNLPPNTPADIAGLNTTADLLAACVDTPAGSALCTQIFNDSTIASSGATLFEGEPITPGFTPTDTLQLALIVESGLQQATLAQAQFMLIPAQSPFQPTNVIAPAYWGFSGFDMISVTGTGDGVVHIPLTQGAAGAFAVAASVGALPNQQVTLSLYTDPTVPASATICQTSATTGQCLNAPSQSVSVQTVSGTYLSFSVFVQASAPITNSPNLLVNAVSGSGSVIASNSLILTTN